MEQTGIFGDMVLVATQNWLWLLSALILGIVVGWLSFRKGPSQPG